MNSKEKHEKYFLEYQKHKKKQCEDCGKAHIRDNEGFLIRKVYLTVHHIDENVENNSSENLMTLCRECHDRIHGFEPSKYVYKTKNGRKLKLQPPMKIWREGKLYNIFTVK